VGFFIFTKNKTTIKQLPMGLTWLLKKNKFEKTNTTFSFPFTRVWAKLPV